MIIHLSEQFLPESKFSAGKKQTFLCYVVDEGVVMLGAKDPELLFLLLVIMLCVMMPMSMSMSLPHAVIAGWLLNGCLVR